MKLKSLPIPALFLSSLLALAACTQVPPPQGKSETSQENQSSEKAQDPDGKQEELESLVELQYGQLELHRDEEGSRSLILQVNDSETMKVSIYQSCDPEKKIIHEAALDHRKDTKLFDAVTGVLSGKSTVKAGNAGEPGIAVTLTLTGIKNADKASYLQPVIESAPDLIADLEKFVEAQVVDATVSYKELELQKDQEGSKSYRVSETSAGTLKVSVYDSCDLEKKTTAEIVLEKSKNPELYEGLAAVLSGKSKVVSGNGTDGAPAVTLGLTDAKSGEKTALSQPVIENHPSLLGDLEQFVSENTKAASSGQV